MKRITCIFTVVIACGLNSTSAFAAFSPISDTTWDSSSERLVKLFDDIYGGWLTSEQNINENVLYFNNATLTRIDDGITGVSALDGSDTHGDQLWHDGTGDYTVEIKIAGNTQEFGYRHNGSYTMIEDNIGGKILPGTKTSKTVDLPDTAFEWILKSGGRTFSSDRSENADNLDYMLTWQVDYNDSDLSTWVYAWEDLPLRSSDVDYNDLVIEVAIAHAPLPSSFLMGLPVLAVSALRRRRVAAAG